MKQSFVASLWKDEGATGWHFVTVPEEMAPLVTASWGRTPVHANVNGYRWATSVWRTKDKRTLLAIPAAARKGLQLGQAVTVSLEPR